MHMYNVHVGNGFLLTAFVFNLALELSHNWVFYLLQNLGCKKEEDSVQNGFLVTIFSERTSHVTMDGILNQTLLPV